MANLASSSDHDLIVLLNAGSEQAFAEIYKRYRTPLFLHAYRALQDDEEAKDIVQATFSAIWVKHGELSIRSSLNAYLYGAVRNRILKFIARQKVATRYLDSLNSFLEKGASTTDAQLREKELLQILEKEIAALPPKMREVFQLSRQGLLSHKQIAQRLGLSDKTVKKQINNAIRILRLKIHLAFLFGVINKFDFQWIINILR